MVTCMQKLVVDMKSFLEPLRNEKDCLLLCHLCVRRDLLIWWKILKQIQSWVLNDSTYDKFEGLFVLLSIPRLGITKQDK